MPIAPHALALPRARRERPHERRAADKANDEFRRFIGSPQELLNRGGRARRLRRKDSIWCSLRSAAVRPLPDRGCGRTASGTNLTSKELFR